MKSSQKKKYVSQIQDIQSNRIHTLGLVAVGVIHELNNPMMGILNFTQYCIAHTSKNDKRYSILQDIEHATNRCIETVQNLLSVIKLEGNDSESFVRCDISTIFSNVLQLLSYHVIKNRVSLSQSIEKDLPNIYLQKSNVQLLLINLMLNAFDSAKESQVKEISIDASKNNDNLYLKISYTGERMLLDDNKEIYDPSCLLKSVSKEMTQRLSVCHRIVKMYNGNIRIENSSKKHTTFIVELPIRQGEKDEHESSCH